MRSDDDLDLLLHDDGELDFEPDPVPDTDPDDPDGDGDTEPDYEHLTDQIVGAFGCGCWGEAEDDYGDSREDMDPEDLDFDDDLQLQYLDWMAALDRMIRRKTGMSVHDLPDMPTHEGFDSGASAREFFAEEVMPHLVELGFGEDDSSD